MPKGNTHLSGVDSNATLVFSFIGYVTQEIALNGRTVVDVALSGEITDLDEVVVVGYSTQKRANVVGSVTSISGASIQSVPSPNVSTSLAGRLPGSIVIQGTGEPGAYATKSLFEVVVLWVETETDMLHKQHLLWLLMVFPDVQWMKLTRMILKAYQF